MNNLTNYILEKLHIDKDIKLNLIYPVSFRLFFYGNNDTNMIKNYIFNRTGLKNLHVTRPNSVTNEYVEVSVNNREEFLKVFVTMLRSIINKRGECPDININEIEDKIKTRIKNFDQIKDYIYDFSNEEIKKEYNNLLIK